MILPSGMDEKSVLQQIDKIVNRISPKYVFYGYTVDDIKQESFLICMEGLRRYDASRPLENFLSVHLSNRLKNFIRDNHFTKSENDERVKILKPAQLDYENSIVDNEEDESEPIDVSDMKKIIDRKLPASYRLDYLKMINDVYISKQRREEIIVVIKDILSEHGYEKG